MPRYRLYRRCTTCRHELTDQEVYYSHGMCQHCGVVSGVTVTDHTKTSELIPAAEKMRGFLWHALGIVVFLVLIVAWAAL